MRRIRSLSCRVVAAATPKYWRTYDHAVGEKSLPATLPLLPHVLVKQLMCLLPVNLSALLPAAYSSALRAVSRFVMSISPPAIRRGGRFSFLHNKNVDGFLCGDGSVIVRVDFLSNHDLRPPIIYSQDRRWRTLQDAPRHFN